MLGLMMSRTIGMPVTIEDDDFDTIYVKRLAENVRGSAIDQAVLLAQDEVYNEDGSKRDFGSFHVPNDYLFKVCKDYPEFIPAVSIHPARRDALAELDRCLALGARCLKLLPNCHGVNCSAPAYDAFWEKMAAAEIPLLAHTGGEMTVPVANVAYQDPAYLRRPLEIGVKVIAAHAGSNSSLWDKDYFMDLTDLMRKYPQLYADSSALNTPFRSAALAKILGSDLRERFVHGSDFPVPVGTWYAWLRGLIDSEARGRAGKVSNLIERDFLLKEMMGFEPAHFTRLAEVLRPVTKDPLGNNRISN